MNCFLSRMGFLGEVSSEADPCATRPAISAIRSLPVVSGYFMILHFQIS